MNEKIRTLTPTQRKEVKVLRALPERDIDYRDIPATSTEQWKGAETGRFLRPIRPGGERK